jgi:hypothetical protein
MPVDKSAPAALAGEPAQAARRLLRTALKASLGTLDRETGHPYASLVLVATEPDGTPLLLISALALHTRNLKNDARASLLIDATGGLADPMTGGRVTLVGEARLHQSATALPRYLARHPSAETYAGFPDFAVYALQISRAHYIGGFGRIVDLQPGDLLRSVADAAALVEAEPSIIAHMNSDHADAIALYATEMAQAPSGNWRLCGIDPDGIDLLHCSNAARVEFPARIRTPGEARAALVEMVALALAKQSRP